KEFVICQHHCNPVNNEFLVISGDLVVDFSFQVASKNVVGGFVVVQIVLASRHLRTLWWLHGSAICRVFVVGYSFSIVLAYVYAINSFLFSTMYMSTNLFFFKSLKNVVGDFVVVPIVLAALSDFIGGFFGVIHCC
ncbi:9221_t:CDS:2, partial [Dentiscutata erythropus]